MIHANAILQHIIEIKNGIMGNANKSIKGIMRAKNIIVEILAHVFLKTVGILKSIVDNSVTACVEIINVMNILSMIVKNTKPTNVTNIAAAKVMSTVPINSDGKKVRCKIDCYLLQKLLLVTMSLFIIVIICYHCINYRSKQDSHTINIKIESNAFKKKFVLKIVRVIISTT